MKYIKSIFFILLYLVLIFSNSFSLDSTSDKQILSSTLDAVPFINNLDELYKNGEFNKINQYIKNNEILVCTTIYYYSQIGIRERVYGTNADQIFSKIITIAEIYSKEFNRKKILEIVNNYSKYNLSDCNKWLQADKLLQISYLNFQNNKLYDAIRELQNAQKIYIDINDKVGEAFTLMILGEYYFYYKNFECIKYLKESSTFFKDLGDWLNYINIIQKLVFVYQEQSNYEGSLLLSKDSLDITKKFNLIIFEASDNLNIGISLYNLGKHDEALAAK